MVVVASASQDTCSVAVRKTQFLEGEGADEGKVVGFLAVGLNFTTLAVNNLVYEDTGEEQATAAGFILLSMIFV